MLLKIIELKVAQLYFQILAHMPQMVVGMKLAILLGLALEQVNFTLIDSFRQIQQVLQALLILILLQVEQ